MVLCNDKTSQSFSNSLHTAWLGYSANYEHLLSTEDKPVLTKEDENFWIAYLWIAVSFFYIKIGEKEIKLRAEKNIYKTKLSQQVSVVKRVLS